MKNSPQPRYEREGGSMQAYRAIEDFDAAWQSVATGAAPPRLESVLQSIPQSERPTYLRKLLAIELEYRAKRVETVRMGDYVQRLSADPEMIQSVFAECGIVSPDDPS